MALGRHLVRLLCWAYLPSTPQPILTAVLLDIQAAGVWGKDENNS